jgi:hypothetical protein
MQLSSTALGLLLLDTIKAEAHAWAEAGARGVCQLLP